MKCINCGKEIDNTYEVCPACNFIQKKSVINLNIDEKKDNRLNFDMPRLKGQKKKNKHLPLIIILIILFLLIPSFLFYKIKYIDNTNILNTIINKVDNFITSYIENLNYKYELSTSINGDNSSYEGIFNLDFNNRFGYLSLNETDVSKVNGVVINNNFNLEYLFNGGLYLKSTYLFDTDDYILFDINNKYLNSNYDYHKLYNGLLEAFKYAVSKLEYTTSKDKLNYVTEIIKTNKLTIKFDNDNKLIFLENFYDSIMKNDELLSELSIIYDKSKDDIITELKQLITKYAYKYGSSEHTIYYLNIYYSITKLYGIELTYNDENYTLLIRDNKLYYDHFINNKNMESGTVEYSSSLSSNGTIKELFITYDDDNYVRDFNLKLDDNKENINTNVNKYTKYNEESKLSLNSKINKYKINNILVSFS